MYVCAEQFLLTDDYQDRIYRKYVRSHKIADNLYFSYKNELALTLSRNDDAAYLQLLLKYYYPLGTQGMTRDDMISAAVKRLTFRSKDFYVVGKKDAQEVEIDFKSKDELSDGRVLTVYSVKWQGGKDVSIYNTVFMKRNISGFEVSIPVQHNLVYKNED